MNRIGSRILLDIFTGSWRNLFWTWTWFQNICSDLTGVLVGIGRLSSLKNRQSCTPFWIILQIISIFLFEPGPTAQVPVHTGPGIHPPALRMSSHPSLYCTRLSFFHSQYTYATWAPSKWMKQQPQTDDYITLQAFPRCLSVNPKSSVQCIVCTVEIGVGR